MPFWQETPIGSNSQLQDNGHYRVDIPINSTRLIVWGGITLWDNNFSFIAHKKKKSITDQNMALFEATSHYLVISWYLFKCLPRALGQLIMLCYWCKVYQTFGNAKQRLAKPSQSNQCFFSEESMSLKSPKRLANPCSPTCKIMDVAFHDQPNPLLICQAGSFSLLFC